MKPPTRRILVVVGALLALVVVLLVLLPVLFADRIEGRVKTEVNRTLHARVDWRDAGLGLFQNFPNLTLRLDDLTAVGVGKFEGDTLASVRQLRVVLDLATALRSALGGSAPIVVRAVELDRPRLSLVALEDGTANWDITRKDTGGGPEARGRAPACHQPPPLRHRQRVRRLRQPRGQAARLRARPEPDAHRRLRE